MPGCKLGLPGVIGQDEILHQRDLSEGGQSLDFLHMNMYRLLL